MRRVFLVLAGLLGASPVRAQQAEEYCPDRPGLSVTPCVIAPGRVSVETGLFSWQRDKSDGARTDRYQIGDTDVRWGIGHSVELRAGWMPYGVVHVAEADGAEHVQRGVGDLRLGAKLNLRNPDGSGFSAGLMPMVSLPVGDDAVGAGDWGVSLLAPVAVQLNDSFSLEVTPQVAAAVDADGDGRHLSYGTTAGITATLSDAVETTAEVQIQRDDDPGGPATGQYGAFSIAWVPSDDWQVDLGVTAGLNDASSIAQLYGGISHRF